MRQTPPLLLALFCFLLTSPATFAGTATTDKEWDLKDVTIILPYQSLDAGGGIVLNEDGYAPLPKDMLIRLEVSPDPYLFSRYYLSSIRIDPCELRSHGQGGSEKSLTECAPEFRASWTKVNFYSDGESHIVPDALHSFHPMPMNEFLAFARSVKRWRIEALPPYEHDSLSIHPAMYLRQSYSSPFWAKLKSSLVAMFANYPAKQLTRRWSGYFQLNFAGVMREPTGELSFLKIPGQPDPSVQVFKPTLHDPKENLIFQHPVGHPDKNERALLAGFFADGAKFARESSREQVWQVVGALHRLENPLKTNPRQVDCMSCHAANIGLQFLSNKRNDINIWKHPDRYLGEESDPFLLYHVRNEGGHRPTDFGFRVGMTSFRDDSFLDPQIAGIELGQRVINESAEVARWMNRNFPFEP